MSDSSAHRITMAALATVFRLQVLIIIQYLYLSDAGSTTHLPPNVCGNLFKWNRKSVLSCNPGRPRIKRARNIGIHAKAYRRVNPLNNRVHGGWRVFRKTIGVFVIHILCKGVCIKSRATAQRIWIRFLRVQHGTSYTLLLRAICVYLLMHIIHLCIAFILRIDSFDLCRFSEIYWQQHFFSRVK